MIIAVHTTTTPHRELYFYGKEHQINLWCCLNNNINIKDNNINDNNINDNNISDNKINNNYQTKQP